MSTLWHIYRDNGSIVGPLTADEVRLALRRGDIDPYDLASRAGSHLRVELIEIDELFTPASLQETLLRHDSVYDHTDLRATAATGSSSLPQTQNPTPIVQIQPITLPGQSPVKHQKNGAQPATLPQNYPKAKAKHKARQRQAKKFMLHYRGRILGPFSAQEIMSLYYRGNIGASARIQLKNNKNTVTIERFIVAYNGLKANKYLSQRTRLSITNHQQARLAGKKALLSKSTGHLSTSQLILLLISALFLTIGFVTWVKFKNINTKAHIQPIETPQSGTR